MAEDTITSSDPIQPSPQLGAAIDYAEPLTPDLHTASGITRGDVAALAVRLMGIYLVIAALPMLGYLLETVASSARTQGDLLAYVLYEAVLIAMGLLMIIKAATIGSWILPRSTMNAHVPPASGSPQELQAVAFSVVSVVLIAFSFPGLVAFVAAYASGTKQPLYSLIHPSVEFIIGLLLFFEGKRLARYWQGLPLAAPPLADDDSRPL